jgi:hypothetical protein
MRGNNMNNAKCKKQLIWNNQEEQKYIRFMEKVK